MAGGKWTWSSPGVWSGSALMGRVRLKGRDRGCVPAGQGLQLLFLYHTPLVDLSDGGVPYYARPSCFGLMMIVPYREHVPTHYPLALHNSLPSRLVSIMRKPGSEKLSNLSKVTQLDIFRSTS